MDTNLQPSAQNLVASRGVLPRPWDTFDAYLFDVDGTLLNCADAVHYFAFCEVLKSISGRDINLDGVTAHGNTDTGILRDALTLADIPESAWRLNLAAACEFLCASVLRDRNSIRARVLPGVVKILEHLHTKNALLGVATGNLETIGRIKLESCGLLRQFDFHAFSDGLEYRADVYSRALERARSLAGNHAAVCAIGDTPADIHAARTHRINIIAVATGTYSPEQLSAEQPDLLLSSLRDLLS